MQPITLQNGLTLRPDLPDAAKALIYGLKRDPLKDLCYKMYDAISYQGDPRPSVFGSFYSKEQLQAFAVYMLEGHTSGFKPAADPLPVKQVTQTVTDAIPDCVTKIVLNPDQPVKQTLPDWVTKIPDAPLPDEQPAPLQPVDPETVEEPEHVFESNRAEIEPEPEPVYSHGSNGDGVGVLDQLRDVFGKLGIKGGEPVDMVKIKGMIDEATKLQFAAQEAIVAEMIRKGVPLRVEIVQPDKTIKVVGKRHCTYPKVLKMASIRKHIALVGPAGSGKTHTAHQIAEDLGIPFEAISIGPQTTQSLLMGYMNADGRYVDTAFRRRFQHGGVILLDEFDAGTAGVGTSVNAATSNSGCGFPDGYIERHRDFICILAMNTFGLGASRDYVGRNELDRATRTRFAFIDFDYDEVLEMDICTNKEWCNRVQKLRHSLFQLKGIKHCICPRASYDGADALAIGIDRAEVERMYVWQGLAQTEIDKIVNGAGL